MKKTLFLLLCTVTMYGQTYQNPTFGTITTKTAPTVTTTPHLAAISATGVVGKIDPVNLPISTATQTALNDKASDVDVLRKTGNLNESANGEKIFTSKIGAGTLSSPLINIFEAKVATGTGFSGSEGVIIHDGETNRLGLNLGVNTSLSYAWLQSSQASFAGGRALTINPWGGNVTIGASTNNGYKFQVEGGGQTITHNNQGASLLINNGSNSEYIEFKKTGYLDRVSFGALGGNEANVSYNMDYATGVHKYYDPAKNAMWLAMNPNVFAVQFAPSGLDTSGDMWTLGGSRYLFLGDSSGRFAVNTNLTTNRGDSQMMVIRNANKATLTGDIDLVLEGNKQSGTAGPVYTNRYNTGTTYLNSGGGVVGIGINPANVPANILEINTPTATGSSGSHGMSLNDQAVNKQSLNLGINTAGGYSWLQSSKGGVGVRPIFLNPNGGGVSIGNTTDLGTGTLNVSGNISTIAATTANHVVIKSQHDLKADLASPTFTGNPTAPTPTAGDNDTSIATTAFVTTADNLKANIASPTLTGNPTAPTPTAGDNDTSIPTTAFVQNAIATAVVTARPYKVYTAILTQTGTSAPVATVLENTTNTTITWTRGATGDYSATPSIGGLFLANKTAVFVNRGSTSTNNDVSTGWVWSSASNVRILTYNNGVLTDSCLSDGTVEIRVYP